MKLDTNIEPHKIVADEGKHIRGKDDVYVAEYTDEEGNLVPEHIPHYSPTIYVPNNFTEKQMYELYFEKFIDEPEPAPEEPKDSTELKAQAYDILIGEVE